MKRNVFCGFRTGALLCLAALLALTGAAWAGEGWTVYENERFGYSAEYPDFFVPDEEQSENGDGLKLTSKDGRNTLLFWGSWNVLQSTLDGLYQEKLAEARESGALVEESGFNLRDGEGFGCLTRGEDGVCTASYIAVQGDELIGGFSLSFPEDEAEKYEGIFRRMARSFVFSKKPL